ncbi:hypothetical protein [Pseudonocardia sp. HH130630-07]|uniref:hypothetical protein n=1 Tax=Pseudonocardia sp. HH130630-07 TaxID=1690815 RepID=UPI000814FB7B|nr:hypothetical protein [Pseudonocardia sp. HH130630-07]ANY05559.1 hypothetical protein AFB00_03720 [Pseudonocardia sp. HH130630-07]
MSKAVDQTVEYLDMAMRDLKRALNGIPYRTGGFKNTHDQLARDVAVLTVQLDASRGVLREQKK